ncbi:hypothetical protein F5Y14DRAFT_194578 [Nemania sp. NC0429]|nr:hypothetical protein F5Y14DRAFT_194578 [Nemania sp. NC0429]
MSSTETPETRGKRALQAAHWLFETQKAQLAEDPNRPRSSITSTRMAADRFGVAKSTVARQLSALKKGKPNASTGHRRGRPSRFTEAEEQMISFHLFMLRRAKRPVGVEVVRDTADALLSRKTPPGLPVSTSWVKRFLRENRAQARQEATQRDNAPPMPPSEEEPGEADMEDEIGDEGDEDVDFDEDPQSDSECVDPNLDTSLYGHTSFSLGPVGTSAEEQLVNTVARSLTTTQPS